MALATCSLFGALSPINQSIREIDAILNSPELAEGLGQNYPIDQIERFEDGYYLATQKSEIIVKVVYDEKPSIGARQFKLIFLPSDD